MQIEVFRLFQQFDGRADDGQRGTQLVTDFGDELTFADEQLVQPVGGDLETFRQFADFVLRPLSGERSCFEPAFFQGAVESPCFVEQQVHRPERPSRYPEAKYERNEYDGRQQCNAFDKQLPFPVLEFVLRPGQDIFFPVHDADEDVQVFAVGVFAVSARQVAEAFRNFVNGIVFDIEMGKRIEFRGIAVGQIVLDGFHQHAFHGGSHQLCFGLQEDEDHAAAVDEADDERRCRINGDDTCLDRTGKQPFPPWDACDVHDRYSRNVQPNPGTVLIRDLSKGASMTARRLWMCVRKLSLSGLSSPQSSCSISSRVTTDGLLCMSIRNILNIMGLSRMGFPARMTVSSSRFMTMSAT